MISEDDVDVSTAMATLVLHNAQLERDLDREKRHHALLKASYEMIEKDMLNLRPNYYHERASELTKDVVSAPSWDWQKLVKKDESEDAAPEAE